MLYILPGQSPERKNLGVMRSIGAKPDQARRYPFLSGMLPAVVGVIVGTLLSNTAAKLVQDKLVSLTLVQSSPTLTPAVYPWTTALSPGCWQKAH